MAWAKKNNQSQKKEIKKEEIEEVVADENVVEENSVFNNIPEPKKWSDVNNSSDNEVKKSESNIVETVDEPQIDNRIFCVVSGNEDEIEYYTYHVPKFKDNILEISEPFIKGSISEVVVDKKVHEYYNLAISEQSKMFLLSKGIFLKEYEISELNWINITKAEASAVLKEKVIKSYQQLVPNLVNRIHKLENIQKKEQRPRREQFYEEDDDLMKL